MATRNLDSEKRAVDTFIKNNKRKPVESGDWDMVHKLAYPGEMPAEFQSATNESLAAGGQTAPLTQAERVEQASQGLTDAKNRQAQLPQSGSFEFGRILQNAIKTKTGEGTGQSKDIGESDIFKQAGLTGMPTLSQSLAARGNEIQISYENYRDVIGELTGTYKVAAEKALIDYNNSFQEYRYESDKLQKIEDDLRRRQESIEDAKTAYGYSVELAKLNARLDPNKAVVAEGAGLEWDDKTNSWKQSLDTTFYSPSGDNINIGRYAQLDDGTPNPEHIAAMNTAKAQMMKMFPDSKGQLKTITDMANFIHEYYPNSPISADAIANAAEKYGMDWETIIATMVAETGMGTDGSKGSREFNYGNVGNTNKVMADGRSVGLPNMQAGVDAVAKTLANPKYYPRNIEGIAGGNRSSLTAMELSEANLLAKEQYGASAIKTKDGYANFVKPIIDRMLAGESIDDIADSLRWKGQSPEFTGNIRSAAQQITSDLSPDKTSAIFDKLDDVIDTRDPEKVKDYLRKMAIDNASTSAEAAEVKEKTRTIQFLEEIRSDLNEYEAKGGKTNLFTGTQEKIASRLGGVKDPELRAIATKIAKSLQAYRKVQTGVAFSKKENKEYTDMFPGINKTANFNMANLDALTQTFSGDLDMFYSFAMGSDAYEELFKGENDTGVVPGGLNKPASQSLSDEEAYEEYKKIKQQ